MSAKDWPAVYSRVVTNWGQIEGINPVNGMPTTGHKPGETNLYKGRVQVYKLAKMVT